MEIIPRPPNYWIQPLLINFVRNCPFMLDNLIRKLTKHSNFNFVTYLMESLFTASLNLV